MFKRGTLTRGAPLSGVRRAYSKPPIWCFANTGNCYFWHVPTTTNQFFDTLTMQVSRWIAARLAVLVEFAVFLISSTNSYKQVEKCFYLLFYYVQIPRRIELCAGRGRKENASVAQSGTHLPNGSPGGKSIPESALRLGRSFRMAPQAESPSRNRPSERDALSRRPPLLPHLQNPCALLRKTG